MKAPLFGGNRRLLFRSYLLLVAGLLASHWFLTRFRDDFAEDRNTRPQRFFRIINEVPTVLMIFIVVLVIVRPF